MTPDPKKQSIIKAPSRAVAKARSNMASRALASVHKTTITNSIGMQLKLIPAGEFLMGSPETEPGRQPYETQHRVRITRPFYLGIHTVTQSQWTSVMGSEPWVEDRHCEGGADHPATNMRHHEAGEFCRKLSVLEKSNYRLPTEAEWEYACRAGSSTAYCFGENIDQLNQYAAPLHDQMMDWVFFESHERGYKKDPLVRVGQKLPNAFGLYDMHGSVREWCSDWYGEYPSKTLADPIGPSSGSFRVLRGGSEFDCSNEFQAQRSASRAWANPFKAFLWDGFRVCLSLPIK